MDALDYGKSFQFSTNGRVMYLDEVIHVQTLYKAKLPHRQWHQSTAAYNFPCGFVLLLPTATFASIHKKLFCSFVSIRWWQRKAVNFCRRSLHAISWSSTVYMRNETNTKQHVRLNDLNAIHFCRLSTSTWIEWVDGEQHRKKKNKMQTHESKRWVS